jgi:hypothetical protein
MKLIRNFTSTLFAIVLCITLLPVSAFAAEKPEDVNTKEIANINFGEVDIFVNEELGLIIETTEVTPDGKPIGTLVETDYSQVFSPNSTPEKEVTKTFSHRIFDRKGVLMATVLSTVKGIYSQVDSYAYSTDIDPVSNSSDISFSTSISGADGYLDIYYQGMLGGSMHYHISTNGSISN